MPRSLLAAMLLAALLLPALALAPVFGATPSNDEVAAVAVGHGLLCDEPTGESGSSHLACQREVQDQGTNIDVSVTYNVVGSDPPTAFATVATYTSLPPTDWVDLAADVALLFCDDSPSAVRTAVASEAPEVELVGCTIRSSADESARMVDVHPTPESTTPQPVPSGDWAPRGTSVYVGAWTLTAWIDDSGSSEPEQEVGSSVPGALTIRCDDERNESCAFLATKDGEDWWTAAVDVVDAGMVHGVRESELDNCEDGQIIRNTHDASYGPDMATATIEQISLPRTCADGPGSTLYMTDTLWTFDGTLIEYTALPAPDEPEASAAPAPAEPAPAEPAPVEQPQTTADRSFAESVPTPGEINTDPIVLLQSAALAVLLVFLMPFPGQLFNSTLEAHEDEVRRWFRLDRICATIGGIGAFWASWPGVIAFTLLATVLYGFLDPGFGLALDSLATFLGMLVGIVLVTAAFAVPAWLAHRRMGDTARLKVVPLSLLIGVACVLLSRLTGFQPGYLYGLLIGLAFARELSAADEGRTTAIGAGVMLSVAFVAWLGLSALPDGDPFALAVLRTSLAALLVAGLEGVVFGLLPMRFLPGESLYSWNRVAWAALLGVGAFAFFHVLINPSSGYLSDSSRTPLFTVLALLGGFALVSVAFWAWFRFRTTPPAPAD